ncbi:MAG: hypothetical protein ACI9JN_000677 [Bacteroidia bacterium]
MTLFLFGCSDDAPVACEGFTGEPFMTFKPNRSDSLGIFYLNTGGSGDTIFSYKGESINIPIDLNSDTMFYQIIGDSNLGSLTLAYNLEQQYCAGTDELKIYFKTARFTPASTFTSIYTTAGNDTTQMDTAIDYATYLNTTLSVTSFEIKF